jgi:hypothetical protein
MCDLMKQNGYQQAEVEPLTFGVVSLYTATKADPLP